MAGGLMQRRYLAYFLRLIAFVLILIGIVDKNFRASRASGAGP